MTPIFTVFIWVINRSDKVPACCKRKLMKTGKFHKSKERERKERVQRYMRYTYFDINCSQFFKMIIYKILIYLINLFFI